MLKHFRAAALLAVTTLAACAPDSTQPTELIPTGGPQLNLWDPPVVTEVLQRSAPLPHNYVASATVGRGGGVLRIPEAGFSITFPSNAVQQPTEITVTAVEGPGVAYLFEPHGLVFRKPPVITQELRGTAAFGDFSMLLRLEGAYFPEIGGLEGLSALVRETRPALVDVIGWRMRFDVEHFSGYAVSSRRSGYLNSSGTLIPYDR